LPQGYAPGVKARAMQTALSSSLQRSPRHSAERLLLRTATGTGAPPDPSTADKRLL